MAKAAELIGKKFGRLSVVARIANAKNGKAMWRCVCKCGNEKITNTHHLNSGNTQSCGCLQSERTAKANADRVKHGHSRQDATKTKRLTTPEYRTWKAMKERCRNKNAPNYHLYGGRGISICDRWLGDNGFSNFLSDMGPRLDGMTIDRIDVNGDYEPSNCKWSTAKEQAQNRRMTDARRESIMKWAQIGWDLAKSQSRGA